jgi:hypothetical protein
LPSRESGKRFSFSVARALVSLDEQSELDLDDERSPICRLQNDFRGLSARIGMLDFSRIASRLDRLITMSNSITADVTKDSPGKNGQVI